ncbi:MAG: hydrogenase formation protein HypD, partial [Patescibacteria group bacterium]
MKYIDEFRDPRLARKLADAITLEVKGARPPDRPFRFMEFCGGHTHAIFRFGLPQLLPPEIKMIHGPGCPVCVLPMARIDAAIQLAQKYPVTLCTFGDMMRVPGGERMSLLKAKAAGAD